MTYAKIRAFKNPENATEAIVEIPEEQDEFEDRILDFARSKYGYLSNSDYTANKGMSINIKFPSAFEATEFIQVVNTRLYKIPR